MSARCDAERCNFEAFEQIAQRGFVPDTESLAERIPRDLEIREGRTASISRSSTSLQAPGSGR